jgi:hypothetical protein|tara:strand:- start:1475 stop:1771 length:297 start_codon:yes stop_codon:yes gene_type:complete
MLPFRPLNIEDITALLGVCERTVRNHIDTGKFPAPVKVCGKQFWHPDVFYGWLDANLRSQEQVSTAGCVQAIEKKQAQPRLSPVQQAKAAQATKLSRR